MSPMFSVTLLVTLLLIGAVSAIAEGVDGDLSSHPTYTRWVKRKGKDYSGTKRLQAVSSAESPVVALHWTVDETKSSLRVAVAAKATGWVGLGIAEMGGMAGSDIVFFEASENRLVDAYATGSMRPKIDDQQDWNLLESVSEDGLILFEAERKLDTHDTQDWPIKDDSDTNFEGTNLIAAWGDTDEMHYHGPDHRLQATVRFFGDPNVDEEVTLHKKLIQDSEGSIFMNIDKFTVPAKRSTTYVSTCFTITQLVKEQGLSVNNALHIVGFDWLPDHYDLVHHMTIYSSPSEKFKSCDETGIQSTLYTWGKGSSETALFPENIGVLLSMGQGASQGDLGEAPKAFRFEIHYENPKHVKGVKDRSGVRIYYTSQLRTHTAGIMVFADSNIQLRGKPVGEGLQRHSFRCPESCTNRYVPEEGLTVLYDFLHMHQHGMTMQHIQKRKGKEIRRSTVQYYNFDQRGAQIVKQEPFKVLRGDSFDTLCNYNGTKGLVFGSSSSQEMCIAFAFYYPAASVPFKCTINNDDEVCAADYSSTKIENITLLGRWFGMKQDMELLSSSTSFTHSTNRGGLKRLLAMKGAGWFAAMACTLLLVVTFYAARRHNAVMYKKVATDDRGNDLEENGKRGDDGYNCPVGIQSAGSSGMRRRTDNTNGK